MEVKKKIKVMCAFSQTATLHVDTKGWNELFNKDHKNLKYGLDYGIVEFDSKKEAEAYVKGVADANGWEDPIAEIL